MTATTSRRRFVQAANVHRFDLIKVRSDDFTCEVISRRMLDDGWVRIGFTGGSTIDLLPTDRVELRARGW